jgi:hypothetical protein
MASLVLKMSVSLDGYVAPVDGSTDWVAAGWAGSWPGASGPFAAPQRRCRRPRLRAAPLIVTRVR